MNKKELAIDALLLFRQLLCEDEEVMDENDEPCFRCDKCPMSLKDGKCAARILIVRQGSEDQLSRNHVMW